MTRAIKLVIAISAIVSVGVIVVATQEPLREYLATFVAGEPNSTTIEHPSSQSQCKCRCKQDPDKDWTNNLLCPEESYDAEAMKCIDFWFYLPAMQDEGFDCDAGFVGTECQGYNDIDQKPHELRTGEIVTCALVDNEGSHESL